jgi:hypothetical protein
MCKGHSKGQEWEYIPQFVVRMYIVNTIFATLDKPFFLMNITFIYCRYKCTIVKIRELLSPCLNLRALLFTYRKIKSKIVYVSYNQEHYSSMSQNYKHYYLRFVKLKHYCYYVVKLRALFLPHCIKS